MPRGKVAKQVWSLVKEAAVERVRLESSPSASPSDNVDMQAGYQPDVWAPESSGYGCVRSQGPQRQPVYCYLAHQFLAVLASV